uniref:sacsin N-terminal ATP-binding-like domain-containing protein n=1 Tax=Segatella hominis TaxID=2518605 RepID=UPI0040255447
MSTIKTEIAPPSVIKGSYEKLLRKMYISNVAKRLRQLNQPSDVDRKRWVWELIQNAKDTIASDPTRNQINVRIEIEGDIVRFRHDGNPFTSDARFGLLYKYSEDKENSESTGRFGTGFLTTHCLSKVVTIESNMYSNDEKTELCGFSVTMYRDGQIEKELLEGLDKMEESQKYYGDLFEWTTFTYHVSTDSGRRAIQLGIENFYKHITQTMLFCKELASIELNDNGKITNIIRRPIEEVAPNVMSAIFEIHGEITSIRRFLYSSYHEYNKELSDRYRADREIRIDAAIEVDENNCIVSHAGNTSHFCVLPLVGIETQLEEPIILNSPDFEPDEERQSLLLSGQNWDEEHNNISEVGINQIIYSKVYSLYDNLVSYLSSNSYGKLYLLANGLKKAKEHDKLDEKWYSENVIKNYRDVLLKYPVVEPYANKKLKKLADCIFVKDSKNENEVFSLLTSLYPDKLIKDNLEWSQFVWKEGLDIWNTEDLCKNIEGKNNWNNITLEEGVAVTDWYNKFLTHVQTYDERYLKKYALLPNMNGELKKIDAENFKQGEKVSAFIIDLLVKLGKDVKPILLHSDVTAVSLDSKYNSQSYSADLNRLAKNIIDDGNQTTKVSRLMPLISIIPNAEEKYSSEFRNQRKRFFEICTSLYSITDAVSITDNSLLDGAWKEVDTWFVSRVLNSLKSIGSLSKLPSGLDAKWLNDALLALNIQISKLDAFEVLPNQEGNFCAHKNLYEDAGVPEELKDDIFKSVDLNYKEILLHKDIDASAFSVNQNKTIASFAADLKSKFATTDSYACGNYFREKYHYKPQNALDKVALYIVSLLPKDKESELYKYQRDLFDVSKEILPSQTNFEGDISFDSSDLWLFANEYVCSQIEETISSMGTLDAIDTSLGKVGEVKVWEVLNKYYRFLSHANISYSNLSVFSNQNGVLKSFCDLNKDEGNIGDLLKNIISLLVDPETDYRNILMDSRSCLQPQSVIGAINAYKLIDDKIYEYYQLPAKWEDDNYINAVHELIEVWKEQSGQFNETNFPKTKPIEDSIVLNVVWKKEKRELLMNVSSKLTDEQIQIIIENSAQIGGLTDKVKQLEDENEILKSQLAAMGMINESNPEDKDSDDYNVNNLSDIIIPTEIESVSESGEPCTITVAEPQYAGLSAEEMRDYLLQAKTDVKLYLEEKGYRFTKGICEDAWCNIYGVLDPTGREVPIVVHSYKSRRRAFSLNTSDWEQLSKDGSMLWVVTHDGPQCVPFYALPRDTNTIAITFSPENMQYKNRCIALAETLKYFKGLHFNFGTTIGYNKTPEPFNNPNEELKLAMRDMHDLPAQTLPASIGAEEESLL